MEQISQTIDTFLDLASRVEMEYSSKQAELKRCEQLTQDYLHAIELNDLTYHERARIAAGLAKCRLVRRPVKDAVLRMEALAKYLSSPKGKAAIAQLTHISGVIRRVEQSQEKRSYRPRVLDEKAYNAEKNVMPEMSMSSLPTGDEPEVSFSIE